MIIVGNWATQDHFSKVSIYSFSGLKRYKKRVYRTEKIYLETFEKCPGSACFPLLQLVSAKKGTIGLFIWNPLKNTLSLLEIISKNFSLMGRKGSWIILFKYWKPLFLTSGCWLFFKLWSFENVIISALSALFLLSHQRCP